jgi:N-dimethylarginine dimethylaminohydrolase
MSGFEGRVYRRASEVDFEIDALPSMPLADAALFVRPEHFDIAYVINPHMEGNVGSVNTGVAIEQWRVVVDAYDALGIETHVIDGRPGLPDMVFCANQTLPVLDEAGRRHVMLSNMASLERQGEVTYFAEFFKAEGCDVHAPPPAIFEGMGDALWHHDRRLLWLGTGYRTAPEIPEWLSRLIGVKIVSLRLIDPLMYHLDTCLSILDSDSALWVPSAFDEAGRELVERLIPNPIPVPIDEATRLLACNAHCPDGHHVLIQAGAAQTAQLLNRNGFDVVWCETGEFIKSGGSVFCMKQMYWTKDRPD